LPHLPQFLGWIKILKTKSQNALYFRLHGRNRNWYEAGEKERYNYLYSKEELESFRKEIIDLPYIEDAVFFNDCYMGRAIRSAVDIKIILGM